MIAGIRLARERQINVRVIPTSHAIDESASAGLKNTVVGTAERKGLSYRHVDMSESHDDE